MLCFAYPTDTWLDRPLTVVEDSYRTFRTWLRKERSLTGDLRQAFADLDGDGTRLLVNRGGPEGLEELVEVPVAGGTERLWYRATKRWIYNRIAISGDGGRVVFAWYPGSKVYVLTRPGGNPREIADVDPDGDVRQLSLSADGKWAAFTASNYLRDGKLGRVHVNLYVAVTDGSALHRITANALPDKFIPYDLSGDGKTLVWVDDPAKGPWIADAGGRNARRLPAPSDPIQNVFTNATGSTIYYQTINASGVKLLSVGRSGTSLVKVHETSRGHYNVARDAGTIVLARDNRDKTGRRTYWRVGGKSLVKLFSLKIPGYAGSCALSGDGRTAVWVDPAPAPVDQTFVWREK